MFFRWSLISVCWELPDGYWQHTSKRRERERWMERGMDWKRDYCRLPIGGLSVRKFMSSCQLHWSLNWFLDMTDIITWLKYHIVLSLGWGRGNSWLTCRIRQSPCPHYGRYCGSCTTTSWPMHHPLHWTSRPIASQPVTIWLITFRSHNPLTRY